MRLLWLNWRDIRHPWAGGAEIHLDEIAKRLVRAGYDITVLSSHFKTLQSQERINGYEVIRVGDHEKYPLAAWRSLSHLIRDFDVVIEDINKVPIYAPLLVGPAKKALAIVHHLNRRVYFEELYSLLEASIAYILETMMPYVYTSLLGVPIIAASESTRKELLELKADPSKVTVIYNGIDSDKYRAETNDPWRQKTAEPTIVHLGRLKKYKQPHHSLLAFSSVLRHFPNARLVIVGEGEMLEPLKQMVSLYKIPNVQFTGRVSEEKKIELLRRSWINLQTSQKEGWGLGVIEAASCGTPSVAYDVPGLRDSVRDNICGLIVPPKIKQLSSAVLSLLKNQENLRSMSKTAMDYAMSFSWDKSAKKFGEILQKLS